MGIPFLTLQINFRFNTVYSALFLQVHTANLKFCILTNECFSTMHLMNIHLMSPVIQYFFKISWEVWI